jgi:competence protein ComEC
MNGSYGLLSIIASVFFLEFVSFIFLPAAFITIIISSFSGVFLKCIHLFEWLIVAFNKANILFSFNFPSLFHQILYYTGIIFLIINYMKKKRLLFPLLIVSYSIILSLIVPVNPFVTKVVFLDVGQGDATYIHSGSCNILIDTGPPDDYDTVLNFLQGENIFSLDALIITHFHDDHFGEARDIIDTISVSHLYANKESDAFPEISVLEVGNEIQCGNLQFLVLHSNVFSSNENNNSVVLFAHIGTDNYLFLGDIEAEEETKMLSYITEDIDIIKVAHHGSDTSSTSAFLDVVQPKIAIISVGENTYGHPSESIIDGLLESNIVTFRTDNEGTVEIIYIFNGKMRFITHFMFVLSTAKRQLL